jgi:hypothetical protein
MFKEVAPAKVRAAQVMKAPYTSRRIEQVVQKSKASHE